MKIGHSGRFVISALCAILLVSGIEAVVQFKMRPSFWQKTPWLVFDIFKGESFDRVEVYEKLNQLVDEQPDIISVGDSSGFFSLQSNIINRYLDGKKFVNLSTGANHAFDGYKGMAEYMLRRSKNTKYVVLYMFPQLLPQDRVIEQGDLGRILYAQLVSIKAALLPPSAALSPYAKSLVFHRGKFDPHAPLNGHEPSLEFGDYVRHTLGWLHEYDIRYDRLAKPLPFFSDVRERWYERLFSDPSSINAVLDDFYRMVRSYGAQLVVAFAPIAPNLVPHDSPELLASQAALLRFQRVHPDVKFLFPLITTFGTEKFAQFNHVAFEYSFLSSERVGRALRRLLRHPEQIPPFAPRVDGLPNSEPVRWRETGAATPALLNGAMAFYLYAATADARYRASISQRVLANLDASESFQFMLSDARSRTVLLANKGVKLQYDTSQLKAVPVSLSGLAHCDSAAFHQWVQVYGTLIFTYTSKGGTLREPVAWPKTSHLFVPLLVEDGVQKFDGYCPETIR
jgi:hypothetical protein